MTEWLGLPALAAANGAQIDNLIGWIHIFMFILFFGWGGFFIYCLFRFRRSRNPVANYTGVRSHASNYAEVAVAVVEAVLLFAFSIPIWAARVDRMPPENEALLVEVTGEDHRTAETIGGRQHLGHLPEPPFRHQREVEPHHAQQRAAHAQLGDRDPAACFRAFLGNHWLGMTLFAGIAADYAYRARQWPRVW